MPRRTNPLLQAMTWPNTHWL